MTMSLRKPKPNFFEIFYIHVTFSRVLISLDILLSSIWIDVYKVYLLFPDRSIILQAFSFPSM